MSSLEVASNVDKDGLVKGRAEDGTPIRAKISGTSLARQLMEKMRLEKEPSWKVRSRKRAERRHRRNK